MDRDGRRAGDHTLRVWNGTALFEAGRLSGVIWTSLQSEQTPQVEPRGIAYASVPVSPYDAYTRGMSTRFGFGGGSYPYVQRIDAGTDRLGTRSIAIVPLWPVAYLTAILPVIWGTIRIVESRRNGSGCTQCGYNLTGNTSGICPECGTAVAGKAGA